MSFTLLAALEPHDRFATVCVKVARTWEYRGPADDGHILHIELVLADQEVSQTLTIHSLGACCRHFVTSRKIYQINHTLNIIFKIIFHR